MQRNYIYLTHNYVIKKQNTFMEIIILLTYTGPAPIDLAHSLIPFSVITDKDPGDLQSKIKSFYVHWTPNCMSSGGGGKEII